MPFAGGNTSCYDHRIRLYSFISCATERSAATNCGGNFFPRFSARRRIPAHAFGVKKYRCGTSPVSKISDNEHTSPSLGHCPVVSMCSTELSVKNAVGEPIPALRQPREEGSKIPSSVARQHSGDILPNDPTGLVSANNCKIGEHEVATRIVQSFS